MAANLTRRNFACHAFGAGAVALATGALVSATPAPAAEAITPALGDAIEAHRAAIRYDEALYGENGKPVLHDIDTNASDALMADAFLAFAAVPCASQADIAAKVAYILAGPGSLRAAPGWSDEYLSALTGGDGGWITDPDGPLATFLRSLAPA